MTRIPSLEGFRYFVVGELPLEKDKREKFLLELLGKTAQGLEKQTSAVA